MAQMKQPDLKQYLNYALDCVEFKLSRFLFILFFFKCTTRHIITFIVFSSTS